MAEAITQRELRNDSGEIMRRLDQGEAFVVTRNGVPVGELIPLRRRRLVPREAVVAAFAHAPAIDATRFRLDPDLLPVEVAVSAVTMAELAAGPHATSDPDERARRQDRLQRTEATFEPLPFDVDAARAYGVVYAAVMATGRKARG